MYRETKSQKEYLKRFGQTVENPVELFLDSMGDLYNQKLRPSTIEHWSKQLREYKREDFVEAYKHYTNEPNFDRIPSLPQIKQTLNIFKYSRLGKNKTGYNGELFYQSRYNYWKKFGPSDTQKMAEKLAKYDNEQGHSAIKPGQHS